MQIAKHHIANPKITYGNLEVNQRECERMLFISDACDFLPDLNHCKYCDTDKFACDTCQEGRCKENILKLAEKHGLHDIKNMIRHDKHHYHHHHGRHHHHHRHDSSSDDSVHHDDYCHEHHKHHHHHHHHRHDHHHSRNSHHLTYIEDKLKALDKRRSEPEYYSPKANSVLSSLSSKQSSKFKCGGLTCGLGKSKRRKNKRYEVHIYLCSSIWHNEQVTKLRMTLYHTTQLHSDGEQHEYQSEKQFNAEMVGFLRELKVVSNLK